MLPTTMTCLPSAAVVAPEVSSFALAIGSGGPPHESEELQRAFFSFAEAAHSLERSYELLRAEVARLNRDLEAKNVALAESLKENQNMRQQLRQILESLPCGVLVVMESAILQANPEAVRLLNLNQVAGFAHLPQEMRCLFERARESGNEEEADCSEGRWLAARCAALGDGHGRVFIVRDVSERKRLEQAQAQLGRERALAELATVVAHEVRNPLASLELFAGLLAESALDHEPRGWVEQIQSGLRSLAVTVNNVLQFHSSPSSELMSLDLGELLAWTEDFFAPLARQRKVQILLRNAVRGTFFAADRHRLQQVLSNLVLNAIGVMPGGGLIRISGTVSPQGHAVIEIADTGPGVSAADLPKIFDVGFSTHSGAGLGLAVCRTIVGQHAGTIEVASCPGKGAKFTLRFPLLRSVTRSEP